ncbi:hypothetical protein MLD38_038411 [Melastoma candidum]|uniref:Uncharacterized protein n=1 Tax=Melastoma candidum TaxID=119954 RepID=A0ACB9L001_9MYRT|nr:hypothetical protein MLD38_038411 [Melastoma candidum]
MAIRPSPLLLLLILLLLLLLVFADAVALSVADPDPPSSSAPTPAPWTDPISRKLGRHEFVVPSPGIVHSSMSSSSAIDWNGEATVVTRAQSQDSLLLHHHKKVDKSVAGGGVILGGLGTTFLVAVFCYIRATRRHKAETTDAPA